MSDDFDNPEWTEDDFARARPASDLPPEIIAAFPRTEVRLRREAASKQRFSLRIALMGQHDGARQISLAA